MQTRYALTCVGQRASAPAAYSGRPRHNLFFAIMVPRLLGPALVDCFDGFRRRYAFSGGPVELERLHVSVCGVFQADALSDETVHFWKMVGGAIRCEQFELIFDRALTYRNRKYRKPFVLEARQGSESMTRLAGIISTAASVLRGDAKAKRLSITPHITLAWDNVHVAEERVGPFCMPVKEVALVHSHVGLSRYDMLGRWSLVP